MYMVIGANEVNLSLLADHSSEHLLGPHDTYNFLIVHVSPD